VRSAWASAPPGLTRWLLGRLVAGAAVVLATVVVASALIAFLSPGDAPRPGVWAGTVEGVRMRLLDGDFGVSHVVPGAVPVTTLFARGVPVDLMLLAGAVVAGTALGILGGLISAAHPRSALARALDVVASVALCAPAYVFAYGLLLLFERSFGAVLHIPGWFEPGIYETPGADPWHFVQAMLVPWVLVGLPIAAIALRLTASGALDNLDAPFVRTATAAGLRRRRIVGHAARPTYGATAAGLGTQVRALVFNLMFVEYTFFLPGFLWFTKRATGNDPPDWTLPDLTTLAAVAVWSAVLVVVLGLLADLATVVLDPRVALRSG
jgi:ABC-type dipeptide/oligopeptide/nickel transport system permease component